MKSILTFILTLSCLLGYSQTFQSGVDVVIPDCGATVTSTINVSGLGPTIDCSVLGLQSVCIKINHTWDSDLDIFLIAPDLTIIELSTDNGGSGDHYGNGAANNTGVWTCFDMTFVPPVTGGVAPFMGNYLPEGDLGMVNNGQNPNGNWQLQVGDDACGDVGFINAWSLTFASTSLPCPPPPPNLCYTVGSIPYNWVAPAGTPVVMTDDAVTGALPIGFTFCFGGVNYTNFYIGSNGWVGFTAAQPTTFTSAPIPNVAVNYPKNCIMGPWQDWHPGVVGGPYITYQTLGIAPNRTLVVTWNNCPMFSCTTTLGSFQIILYETSNQIDNNLKNKPNCLAWAGGTAVQGLHDITGTVAVTVAGRNSTQWTAITESWRYTPTCAPCAPIVLPIELISFTGDKTQKYNRLSWTTASELNNDYFLLERSVDGYNWSSVSQINGSGNSSQKLDYLFDDYYFTNTTNYYRLSQVDFDGKNETFGVISIDNSIESKTLVKVVNFMGQEVNEYTTGVLIYYYSDGTCKRVIR